jgi:hypothetical protein
VWFREEVKRIEAQGHIEGCVLKGELVRRCFEQPSFIRSTATSDTKRQEEDEVAFEEC